VEVTKRLKNKYAYSIILLRQLVITEFKLRYKGSVLGYVWSLLRPLALFAVLYIVFVQFLRFGADIPHFAVALLLGVVMWNYFIEVTTNGLTSIVSRGDLMRKLAFPRYVIVVAGSFSALINLMINLLVVGFFVVLNGVDITWSALWIVPLIAELFVLGLAVAFLLSALYVKFRDVGYIWELVLQAGFYATPILYPVAMVASMSFASAQIMLLNPVAQIIQDARAAVIFSETETVATIFDNPYMRLIPIAIVILLAVVSAIYFRKKSPGFAEDI